VVDVCTRDHSCSCMRLSHRQHLALIRIGRFMSDCCEAVPWVDGCIGFETLAISAFQTYRALHFTPCTPAALAAGVQHCQTPHTGVSRSQNVSSVPVEAVAATALAAAESLFGKRPWPD
jgi:hypothetical protein